uniref:Dipeptidase n=1 Tax=Neogobius melanostomus TaxID=47308 RepID=A0A8C6S7L8_9GOBI
QMRKQFNNQLSKVDLNTFNETHTNIPKIKAGRLGAQFWSAYVPCDTQYKDAVRQTFEQIDVIHRMCQKYPDTFMFNKTASLIGVEGGHSIDSSLGTLRTMYQLGVRYLTLTHSCNTPWYSTIIQELNRLGMLVDLAHVPVKVMEQVLGLSKAPVIFSHSSAYAICKHKRNVPDNILLKVKGIVMVNFYNDYVTCSHTAALSDVANHFDHIKKIGGPEIVGFGGDYDGVTRLPHGLEDVSKVPNLVAELLRRNWTDAEVKAALGGNLLRVLQEAEKVRALVEFQTSYGYDVPNQAAVHPLTAATLLLTVSLIFAQK